MLVGWALLWVTVITSVVFVTFYGVTFGDEKCRKWLTSMFVSVFTSVLFTQPIKVCPSLHKSSYG